MGLRSVTLLLPLWLAICAASAQDAGAPAQSAALAPARDVTVDLTVRDKKGRPFRKLEASDLEIQDDGTPVKITNLRLVTAAPQAPTTPGQTPRVQTVALVFDGSMTESRPARLAAEEILKQAAPETWFAVFHAGTRLAVVLPYTQDREAARAAVEKATFQPPRRAPRGAKAPAAREVTFTLPPQDSEAGRLARIAVDGAAEARQLAFEENTRSPLAGLLALARSHARFQGTKALVLFSEGLQLTSRLRVLMRDTVATANRVNLSIFAFDTTQLSKSTLNSVAFVFGGPGPTGAAGAGRSASPHQGLLDRDPFVMRQTSNDAQSALRELANGTGGVYESDLRKPVAPVRRLIDAIETHYEAAFASLAAEYDGRYRPVTVAVKNRGLRVRSQGGYVALPPGATADTRPFEIPLLTVLASESLPQAFGLRSSLLTMGRAHALVVEIPLRDLSGLEDASSRLFSLHFSVLARIRNATGETLRTFSQEVPYRIALERRAQAKSGVYTFYRWLSVPAGDYTLESVVLDHNGKRAGAERKTVRVEPAPEGPLVSDILLVRDLEPLPGQGADEDRNCFRYKNSRVIPALDRSFSGSGGTPLRFFLTLDPLLGGRPDVEIRLSRDGAKIAESSFQPPPDAPAEAIPLLFSVPAAGLASGSYEIRVRASQSGRVCEKTAVVQIEGLPTPAGGTPVSQVVDLRPLGAAQSEPEPDEIGRILDGIGKRALEYSERLPNFGCLVVTRRWSDPTGSEQWRAGDSYVELVRIVDNDEEHKIVEVNGKRPVLSPQGMRSSGEFGSLLKMALDPAYQPQVKWREWSLLDSRPVHVFSYRVERGHSTLILQGNLFAPGSSRPAYHGLLYVEPDTMNIRRLTMVSEIPPTKSGSPEVAIEIDYDYIALGQRDHVLPVQAQIRVRSDHGALTMNQLEFRDYRRFSAQSAITFDEP